MLIAVAVTALLAVPIGISVGMSWVELPWSNVEPVKAAPEWVNLPQVRATTIDGTVVKARVALDVPGAVAKNTIQRNTQQVGLLLEVSIAQQTREQIGSPKGITRLSDDMRDRLERLPRRRGRRSCGRSRWRSRTCWSSPSEHRLAARRGAAVGWRQAEHRTATASATSMPSTPADMMPPA